MLNTPSFTRIHSLFSPRTASDWNLEITQSQAQMRMNEVHILQNNTSLTDRYRYHGQVPRTALQRDRYIDDTVSRSSTMLNLDCIRFPDPSPEGALKRNANRLVHHHYPLALLDVNIMIRSSHFYFFENVWSFLQNAC
jgi:hypothetical protein